jgi:hypothetical protein
MSKEGISKDSIVGKKFGHLTVMQRLPDRTTGAKNVRALVLVQCDCGKRLKIPRHYLLRKPNPKTHCGCQRKEINSYTYNPEYKVWKQMIKRCTDPKHISYKHYGAQGVKVHPTWLDPQTGFTQFVKDVGPRPHPKMTLDRIDPFKNYEPGNVRWATAKEQAQNKRANHPQQESPDGEQA